ncbi:hypothetical protein IV203_025112 [Nitzschia inconspicua]|uniref:Uncharacterized protein n=1 Tax=Nitzschia inconspicua TaxID=303405 RepID=A0A9K3P926_9STRA|nr:hypothetical protein IV203_002605 [Nitzschia inconspicua]KAG7339551.1 hypothetical protein IV203_025144 [Nitzschia inconspicua]KAG7365671.1 hypothetical protein IV203_025112 [Nitzschia inconspicua]
MRKYPISSLMDNTLTSPSEIILNYRRSERDERKQKSCRSATIVQEENPSTYPLLPQKTPAGGKSRNIAVTELVYHDDRCRENVMDAQQVARAVATCSPLLVPMKNREGKSGNVAATAANMTPTNDEWVACNPNLSPNSIPQPAVVTSTNRLHSIDAPGSLQTRGFFKWGIPLPSDLVKDNSIMQQRVERMFQMESILMERLVWIRYRHDRYWWPAILYSKGYKELIHEAPHVWSSRVSFWKRLEIVHRMIFDSANPRNKTPVARVLGRPGCELIELPQRQSNQEGKPEMHTYTADFFLELPKILPVAACNIEFFAQDGDYDLYYDWHRALDQVECLFYDCLGRPVPLLPPTQNDIPSSTNVQEKWRHATSRGTPYTWVQRARHAERMQWEEHRKYVGCFLFVCGPDEEKEPTSLSNKNEIKIETKQSEVFINDVRTKSRSNKTKRRQG